MRRGHDIDRHRGRRTRPLFFGVLTSLLLSGASASATFAATGALPVTVTGSTNWSVAPSLPPAGPSTTFSYGIKPLTPLMGDWDGDGDRTPGTFETGRLKLSNTLPPGAPTIDVTFGDPRGFPVTGDFNGDGFDDVAVYRNGLWQLRIEVGGIGSGGAVSTPPPFTFGTGSWPTTMPVAGDWDGDGVDGIGTYTYASGLWQLRQTPEPLGFDLGAFTFWAGSGSYIAVNASKGELSIAPIQQTRAEIHDNTISRTRGRALFVFAPPGATAGSRLDATITNNTIGDGAALSGAELTDAVVAQSEGSGKARFAIRNNTIRNYRGRGLFVFAAGTATADSTVTHNTISDPSGTDVRASPSDPGVWPVRRQRCARTSAAPPWRNSLGAAGPSGHVDVELMTADLRLPGFTTGGDAQAYIAGRNLGSPTVSVPGLAPSGQADGCALPALPPP